MDCSLVAFLVIAAKLNKLPEMIPLVSSVFIPYDTMYKKLVYGTVDNWPFPLNMFLSYRDCVFIFYFFLPFFSSFSFVVVISIKSICIMQIIVFSLIFTSFYIRLELMTSKKEKLSFAVIQ